VAVWAVAATALATANLTTKWEGYLPRVYLDPAGIPTFCYGETQKIEKDPTWVYSKDYCAQRLRERMKKDYAPKLAQCLPELLYDNRLNISAALLDASYNAGWKAVCNSPMARYVKAGQWKAACNSLEGWYTTAKDRRTGKRIKLKGLVNRRIDEKNFCLKDFVG